MNAPEFHEDESEAPASPGEKRMGFWDHLNELRSTIIKSVVVFAVFSGLIGYYFKPFNALIMEPFDAVRNKYPDLKLTLGTTSPMEGVSAAIQICLYGGLLLSAPFILFFIGQFVAPALTRREMRAVLPMCLSALVLFVSGALFAFMLLLPAALEMGIDVNTAAAWENRWTVGSYYGLAMGLVFGVGAVFEFPLVVVLLVWLGLISTKTLRKYRRHAIVGIFVVAAIVTPSAIDPFQQCALAAPLLGLYEIAILVARRIEKHRERSAAAIVVALLALLPNWRRAARASAFPLGNPAA